MENASKALIIAGAILLSILIISLGLMVYNQAKETIGSVNLSQQEIEAFNAKFTSYEGTKVSGAKVNSLIQTVISSNQAEVEGNTGKTITIDCAVGIGTDGKFKIGLDADGKATVTGTARVATGKFYKVTLNYGNKAVVSSITIENATP